MSVWLFLIIFFSVILVGVWLFALYYAYKIDFKG